MDESIKVMLKKYNPQTTQDYINALKEIIQEIALLGLWRAKFYEHAAFYGGTALRVLYGLDRFSEDLDFSLLEPNSNFSFKKYNQAIKEELQAFGFSANVEDKIKNFETPIQSAFIKAETKKQLLEIEVPNNLVKHIHQQSIIRIKMEVDTNPPVNFQTEAKYLLLPIPFSVLSFTLPNLFAGKLHAILCRQWKTRVKGRDWYDLVWYISRQTPVNLLHLKTRLQQSGHWDKKTLSLEELKELLKKRIKDLDITSAKKDVSVFIKNPLAIEVWSQEFFNQLIENIQSTENT